MISIKNLIIEEYVEGATQRELAAKYGVSQPTISRITSAAGVSRSTAAHLRKFSDEQAAEIRNRADGGETYTSLAKEFGCSQFVIFSIANRRTYVDDNDKREWYTQPLFLEIWKIGGN
jgi:Mor family transcriptional regulator